MVKLGHPRVFGIKTPIMNRNIPRLSLAVYLCCMFPSFPVISVLSLSNKVIRCQDIHGKLL